MIKILDRYIIRQYLATFGFVLMALTLIACVIDLGEKIEEFKEKKATLNDVIFGHYIHFIAHINALLFPLIALIAVVFFTSRLAYNSEVISILNAGVSFKRFIRPYLIAGGLLATSHLLLNHYIVPEGNKRRLEIERKYITTIDKAKNENVHLFLNPRSKIFIGYYSKYDTTMRDVRLEEYDSTGTLLSLLRAENAKWLGYPNRWQLLTCNKRTFKGLQETFQTGISTLDTALALSPEDFIRYHNQNEAMTTGELNYEIAKLESRGMGNTRPYEIEKHRRTADACTILILTLIGAAIAARKVRGGMGLHLALGVGLGALFILASKFSVTFALQPNMPAWFGVWIPNILFGIVAAVLVSRAQK